MASNRKPMTAAERLSRNRAAKRATVDTTLQNHLSSLHHMNRRIYTSYRKAGLLGTQGGPVQQQQQQRHWEGEEEEEEQPREEVLTSRTHQMTPPPHPPSYAKRHVQQTAAALKTAILDEICEHRIYESKRLAGLFRSYLSLNADQPFFPTLSKVCQELRYELGVAAE